MKSIEVEIGGKKRKFSFASRALGNVVLEFDNDIANYLKLLMSNGFVTSAPTLYHLHAHAVRRDGGEIDFTVDDVEDWIDELDRKFHNEKVQEIINGFITTLKDYLPEDEEVEENSKKK